MKLYREVKCSDRLPTIAGPYYIKVVPAAIDDTMRGFGQHDIYQWFDNPSFDQDELWTNTFESWLEPYELPTEEEIIRLRRVINRAISYINQFGRNDDLGFHIINELAEAKAITNLLKGER